MKYYFAFLFCAQRAHAKTNGIFLKHGFIRFLNDCGRQKNRPWEVGSFLMDPSYDSQSLCIQKLGLTALNMPHVCPYK